jgi:hypothetical protein
VIVIPMAGLSRRFTEAGYTRPKYMLDLHGRTLFAHAVESFRELFGRERFLFVARDQADTAAFIARETAALGLGPQPTVMLDRPTRGQAETVRLGLEAAGVDAAEPLTIFNIDWAGAADGWLEVMRATDPGFSFVLPDPAGEDRVRETAEKRVISDLASTGVYGFRRAGDFLEALGRSGEVAGELYVAPVYNALIARGGDVRYREVDAAEVIFCGTPEQYQALGGAPA